MSNNKYLIIFTLFLTILFADCTQEQFTHEAVNGHLDLSEAALDKMHRLDGEWDFFPFTLSQPGSLPEKATKHFLFPYTWNGTNLGEKVLGGDGYHTFRLIVTLPVGIKKIAIRTKEQATAYRLYANGKLVAHAGQVGNSKSTSIPHTVPDVSYLILEDTKLELVMQVSNFHHRNGGIWHGIQLSSHDTIQKYIRDTRLRDIFLTGIIFLAGIYHIGLHLQRRKDRLSLIFALFCIAILFRHLSTGEKILLDLFSFLPYRLYVSIEYISWFWATPLGLNYTFQVFPQLRLPRLQKICYMISIIMTIIVVVLPVKYFSWTVVGYQFVFLSIIAITFFTNVKAFIYRLPHAGLLLIGTSAMVVTSVNDSAYTAELIRTGFLAHFGMLVLIIIQSTIISISFSRAFSEVEKLTEHLASTNKAYARFVPTQFLELLNTKDITQIQPGDQVEKTMSILFSDIRDFTSLSETMSPKENFNFINSYLRRMSPIVSKYGGFVDKFIGDAIMALFPGSPENALQAAIEMQKAVDLFNVHRSNNNYKPIQIGIGIHLGKLMLGTVGNQNRMDGTVISDAVNTTARIESLTKTYGAQILISGNATHHLESPDNYKMRQIGSVEIRGKSEDMLVYEVYEGRKNEKVELYDSTRALFERGVYSFLNEDYEKCREIMLKVLELNPVDIAARFYVKKIQTIQ